VSAAQMEPHTALAMQDSIPEESELLKDLQLCFLGIPFDTVAHRHLVSVTWQTKVEILHLSHNACELLIFLMIIILINFDSDIYS
jgi:hypothetical protein